MTCHIANGDINPLSADSMQQLHKQIGRCTIVYSMAANRQEGRCIMVHQCLPEGLRNGASHQIVLKSEGGDVWHDAQLRWNSPNQLQPGYTVRHQAAHSQAPHSQASHSHTSRGRESDITQHTFRHHTASTTLHLFSKALVRVRMAVCMHMGSSASMQGHQCSTAMYMMAARSQLYKDCVWCLTAESVMTSCCQGTCWSPDKRHSHSSSCSRQACTQAAGIIAAI